MQTQIRKHVRTGLGTDLWLTKNVDQWISPVLGMTVSWGGEAERIVDVVLNLDHDRLELWVEPDDEVAKMAESGATVEAQVDRLSKKTRELMNRGWNLQ